MPFQIIRHQEDLLKKEKRLVKYGRGGALKVCLAYPNQYRAGMSNLGFQTIFHIISSTPDCYCDRTFMPEPSIYRLYKKGARTLIGWESEKPAQEFDVLAFSISFEADYVNVLKMLDLAGIPKRKADRDNSHPLVIAGGAAISINPEVMADFVDIFVIGDGEGPVASLLEVLKNESRASALLHCGRIPGVYVPSLYNVEYDERGFIEKVESRPGAAVPVRRTVCSEAASFAHSRIITPETEFSDTFLLEISRGCPYLCGYCSVSLLNKPYRWQPLDILKEKIDLGLSVTRRIGLLGAAVGSHPELSGILDYIEKKGGEVSFASLRSDLLDDNALARLRRLGQNLLTIAPETGSDELRRTLNKKITNAGVMDTVRRAVKTGFREFRFYIMLGLPGETESHVNAGTGLINEATEIISQSGGRLTVSVNQFIPKPGTYMQNAPLEAEDIVLEKMERLQRPFYNNPAVRFKTENPREAFIQAFLGRGSRRWGDYLLKYYCRSISNITARLHKMRKNDPSIDALVYKQIPQGVKPPWMVIHDKPAAC